MDLETLLSHTHFSKESAFISSLFHDSHILWVNKDRERFADESLTFNPTEYGNAIDRQSGKLVYALCSENLKNSLKEEGFLKTGPSWSLGAKLRELDAELRSEIDKGNLKSTYSWGKIAEWTGVNPEALGAMLDEL